MNGTPLRLAFLGAGWIGRSRLEAVAENTDAEISWVCDTSKASIKAVLDRYNGARAVDEYEQLLSEKPDGVVIATPSAQHYEQTQRALEKGIPVFCQKPLARQAEETSALVALARQKDCLLAVDFSYRYTRGIQQIRKLIRSGALGHVFQADLTFHNAYGPDKSWYYRPELAGGGCLMDLGIHLVDLLFYLFPEQQVESHLCRMYREGKRLEKTAAEVEDFACAQLQLQDLTASLACSWNLPAGKDAEIKMAFYGTRGGVCFENVNGSFYDFQTVHFAGTHSRIIDSPPEAWGGKAVVEWVKQLQNSKAFDDHALAYIHTAEVISELYNHRS